MGQESARLIALREKLKNALFSQLDEIVLNGDPVNRLPNNLNISFAFVEGEGLMMGSAVNVPTRVRVRKPDPAPESETSTPWAAWQTGQSGFDIKMAVKRWLADTVSAEVIEPTGTTPGEPPHVDEAPQQANIYAPAHPYTAVDDDIPF